MCCLDIRTLKRLGFLRPGYWPLGWYRGEQQTGSIGLYVETDSIVLDYRYRLAGGDWEPVQEEIVLDFTACHYGGRRPWFRCPRCQRRVAVLYSYGSRFQCRHCHGLPYGCQQEANLDRLRRKCWKIRDRLGASRNLFEPIYSWEKPKGMHWATFERLRQEEGLANEKSLVAMAIQLGIRIRPSYVRT
jgi:hypothetical protein